MTSNRSSQPTKPGEAFDPETRTGGRPIALFEGFAILSVSVLLLASVSRSSGIPAPTASEPCY